jgi:hypothetical protein
MATSAELRAEWEQIKQRLGEAHPDAVRAQRRWRRKLAHENRTWWAGRDKPGNYGRGG